MNSELNLKEMKKEWHGKLRSYVIGFLLSLMLTGASFLLVVYRLFSIPTLLYIVVGLAMVQAIVQLLFFLHLGQEAKPRWETIVFFSMILVLAVIALGTLWIMHDLNERMMPEMNASMVEEMSHD